MKDLLEQIRQSAMEQLSRVDADLSEIRVKYLGKKGELTAVLRSMGSLSPEERPAFGQRANEVRAQIEAEIERRQTEMKSAMRDRALRAEKLDVTVPGEDVPFGHIHPLSRVQHEIEDIFIGMGYSIAEGPEVELDHYNFQALNIPPEHPARDTQDTFYITDNVLLRSQTSPVQVHVMEKERPPIRILSPGRVYRSDAVDATHSPLFHQIEGLVVDRGVTMGDLKGTLAMFARRHVRRRTRRSASVRTTSRSPSRRLRSMYPASPAAARDAASARARAGSRSSARAWFIRTSSPAAASIPKSTPALRSVSASSASPF